MISCTEFIPAYSELFKFLEKKWGREEVDRFWEYLFRPTGEGIPLINFVMKEGIRGAYSYWSGSLNEEAADFTLTLNEKAGWFMMNMHRCPSKGRLLELKESLGIEPYHDYCLHCDSYRSAAEKVGLKYVYNFMDTDRAACSLLIYDPKVFEGKIVKDENTVVMDRRASDNEYFHKDFHSSMNMAVEYLGTKYGTDALEEYLKEYADSVYARLYADIENRGIDAVADHIRNTYEREKALDVISLTKDEDCLSVKISCCPAVTHLKDTGRVVSQFFPYTTSTLMRMLAERAGCDFTVHYYDEQSGASEYSFKKRDA